MTSIRQSKYNVDTKDLEKRSCNGIVFDSIMEMKYYRDVVLPQVRSGKIKEYELQKKYILQPKFNNGERVVQPIEYIADFYLKFSDGTELVVDTKGCPDSVAKIKRKMFWYHYPDLKYKWICYSKVDGGWCDYEVVQQGRKKRKAERLAKAGNVPTEQRTGKKGK